MANFSLVGRRDMLKKIYRDIDSSAAPVVLKGPEGVGKSTLLTRVITHLEKKKFTALMFRGAASAEMILAAIAREAAKKGIHEAETLFASQVPYREKLEKLLENYVYKEKLLFIFEDFDENQDSDGAFLNVRLHELVTYLTDMIKEKSVRLIFCTSYNIPKFTPIEIEPFSRQEFFEMIRLTTALKQLDKKSLEILYFEMGGFPRAVELLDKIAQHEFAGEKFNWQKLRDRIPNLTERIRHKDSESADFSYLLVESLLGYLNEKQRHLLNLLAIYRGWIDRDMLAVHNREIKPYDLKKPVRLGLLKETRGTHLLEVPRLVARLVRSRMSEPERKQNHRRAAQYFDRLDASAAPARGETQTGRTYGENALEARRHYLEAGDVGTALAMTFDMDQYFCRIGFPQFAFDLLRDLERHVSETPACDQIRFHSRLGVLNSIFGKLDDALGQYESLLKLAESCGDSAAAAAALAQIGMVYEAKGKYDEALDYYQKSLVLSEKLGNTADAARRLDQMGLLQIRLGKYDQAFEGFRKALAINRENNDQKAIAANLEQMGRIHDEQGKFDAALDYYRQSLEIKEILHDRQGFADLLHQMGNVNFFRGNPDQAFSLYRQSLSIKEAIADRKGAGYSLGQIGLILQQQGKIDEALEHFEKSLGYFEKTDEQKGIAAGHHQIGRIYEAKDNREKALTHYEKAVEIREKTGDMLGAAITYGQLGMLYYAKEEYEAALNFSTKAFAIFSRHGSPNAQLARKNMLRLRDKIPANKFDAVLREYGINPGPEQPSPEKTQKPDPEEN
jgi:tetratricopeptide (TPR) repeat protein